MFRLAVLLAAVSLCLAQDNPASKAARVWREAHERDILNEFVRLLSIPNIASDKANIEKNAQTIAGMLTARGVASKLLRVEGANPLVYGEIRTPEATRTVVLYAHYDGQPLDPKEWATPPFTPTLKKGSDRVDVSTATKIDPEWRLYARSTGDDKAPIIAMLTALDAIKSAGIRTKSNIRFAFEGEEEAGSANLKRILEAHKDLLTGDVWLICDGPVHQSRRQQVVFGARGVTSINITVYGPKHELHSGHYGNWAPNPAMALSRLLASMKDDDGRILVEDYYKGVIPLSAAEKRAIAEAPSIDQMMMEELWLGRTENSGRRLEEAIALPSLNVRGMASARVGSGASNVVPASATAAIDMRLVLGITPDQAVDRVTQHIRQQGYYVTANEPTEDERRTHPKVAWVHRVERGYPAVKTSMDLPISKEVIRVVESARGPSIKMPTLGGSVPLYMIVDVLKTQCILIPIANHDNNQHSFNENIRLQNLWDGIELMAALITM
ncbi:MAG: M20/M25/M40 family metallo-hydrolase [Bryobacteraceae bacterium]